MKKGEEMKKSVFAGCLIVLLSTSPAAALNFDIFAAGDTTGIDSWISGLGGQTRVLENFEGIASGWYPSLDTGVGTFTAAGSPGGGKTSYNANNGTNSEDPYFSIQSSEGSWYGRYNTTTDGTNWFDSGDITELKLTGIDKSLTNLFFYIQDPSDVNAITTINANEQENYDWSFKQANAASFFVGITLDENEVLSMLSWTTSTDGDGYGLDDFSTVAPVPEPATMLLFGTGLAGLASLRRRRKKIG